MKQFAVLISGRGTNMEALLSARKRGDLLARCVLVISNRFDAPGLEIAKSHGVPVEFVPWNNRDTAEHQCLSLCSARGVQFLVLAGFMKVITPHLITQFKYRILNIHPALLPSFPGVHAQKQALDYGVRVTGCTTHFVDTGVDTGPIILQRAVNIQSDDTEETLSERILACEHEILVETVNLFAADCLTVVDGRHVRIDTEKWAKHDR